jgi:hypothetical protein
MDHCKRYLMFILMSLMLFSSAYSQSQLQKTPIELEPGPHFFMDEYLIAEQSFLSRTVNRPEKLPEPVVTGGMEKDGNFQPYMSVLRDPETGRFRIWYNTAENISQSHLGYMESEDGINWIRPHRVLKDPHDIKFGVTVLDRGEKWNNPDQRFVLGFWHNGGLMIAESKDGLDWEMLSEDVVWEHNHDINSLHWDPIRKHYLAIGSVRMEHERWEGEGTHRIPHMSVSKDLLNWEEKWPIFMAKIGAPVEKGETQFYAMSGVIARGDLLIGLVKMLRDDLNATQGKTAKEMGDMNRKAAGIGYTVLAWSRDGRTWQRDHIPFLPNDPQPDSWDHAHVWGDEQIIVGDETFLYYAGYKRGHKVERFDERQIGLFRMPRDRYVAREADINMGTLITKPLILNGSRLTVNAFVVEEMRVRLLDESGKPLEGFGWAGIKGDSIDHKVEWMKSLKSLGKKPVRIEFQLRDAQLYSFDLHQ